ESTRAVLYKQLVSDPPPLSEKVPDAPPLLAAAINRAMLKEPRERFATMREFVEAVTTPEPESATQPAKARWRRSEPRKKAAPATASAPVALPAEATRPGAGAPDPVARERRLRPAMVVAGLGLVALAGVLATRGGSSGTNDFQPIS